MGVADVDICVLSHLKEELAWAADERLQVITIVWEKFTVGYFQMKIVCVKIFSSSRVSDEKNSLTTN